MTKKELIEFLEAETAAFPGQCALLMVDLPHRKELLTHNADAPFPAAGVIRVPILLTALDAVTNGQFSLEQAVPVGEVLAGSRVFEPENLRESYSLSELLEWMCAGGDDTAAKAVLELLGTDAVNQFCQRMGAKQTVLEADGSGVTSAKDQYLFFSLLSWCAERSEVWFWGLNMLKRQRNQELLLRYICGGGCSVAHEPGEGAGASRDCGLFLDQSEPYFLGIFTWDCPENARLEQFTGKLSKAIYDCHMEGCI